MTTVFLSGSRRIGRIGDDVRCRIDNMVENNLDIITGDANGADKAMQAYLAYLHYPRVTVFYVGESPRNNVGNWQTRHVTVEGRLSGRDFYSQKDRQMSKIADFGFVLWDGRSSGSVQNMFWLLSEGKKVVVYFAPKKSFVNFKSQAELVEKLAECDEEVLADIGRKIELPMTLARKSRGERYLL